jgi:hypothetical protein
VCVSWRQSLACVVLDSGYSFTHAVPIFDGCKVNYAVKRLDVGGKLLTNCGWRAVPCSVARDTWCGVCCSREAACAQI